MYQVYKITNLINQKCYIGSSNNYLNRWDQHKKISIKENHKQYNYPLYKAFRKYGLDNFSFELLKDNFKTRFEAEEYEQQMIDYYDSYNNGYNQTRETHSALTDEKIRQESILKRSQPCALVDIKQNIIKTYNSYNEAARMNGFENGASKIRDVCKGFESSVNRKIFRDLDKITKQVIKIKISPYKGQKAIICIDIENPENKIYFSSISETAKMLQTDRTSIHKCISGDSRYSIVKNFIIRELNEDGDIIENNISIQEKIKDYNEKNPLINGERHNITEWCNIYGISKNSYYKRIKNGMGVVEAITTPKRR